MMLLSMKQIHCKLCGKELPAPNWVYVPQRYYPMDGVAKKFNCCTVPCFKDLVDGISYDNTGHPHRGTA